MVYAKVLELAVVGGTDYAEEMTGTLLVAVACPPNGSDEDAIMAANIAVAFNNAEAAGANVPADNDELMEAIKCLQFVPGGIATLRRIDLYLNCALGPAAVQ